MVECAPAIVCPTPLKGKLTVPSSPSVLCALPGSQTPTAGLQRPPIVLRASVGRFPAFLICKNIFLLARRHGKQLAFVASFQHWMALLHMVRIVPRITPAGPSRHVISHLCERGNAAGQQLVAQLTSTRDILQQGNLPPPLHQRPSSLCGCQLFRGTFVSMDFVRLYRLALILLRAGCCSGIRQSGDSTPPNCRCVASPQVRRAANPRTCFAR